MLKEISLDFGTLIAYLIPGYVALRGLVGMGVRSAELLPSDRLFQGQQVVTILVGSLVAGMLVSIVRAVVVERTMHWFGRRNSEGHWGKIVPASVDYARLADPGRMAAFQEAKAGEKRPYQFYGNMLLALALLLGGNAVSNPAFDRAGVLVVLLAMLSLYVGARSSYFRYTNALRAINSLPDPTPNEPAALRARLHVQGQLLRSTGHDGGV